MSIDRDAKKVNSKQGEEDVEVIININFLILFFTISTLFALDTLFTIATIHLLCVTIYVHLSKNL